MFDAVQGLLPEAANPALVTLLTMGVVAALAILALGGAFSLSGRTSAHVIADGTILKSLEPLSLQQTLAVPAPEARAMGGDNARSVIDMALSANVSPPRMDEDLPCGCVPNEIAIRVPYGRDFAQAMAVIEDSCRSFDGVLSEPAPKVYVAGLADSAIELIARTWSETSDSATVAKALRTSIRGNPLLADFDIA